MACHGRTDKNKRPVCALCDGRIYGWVRRRQAPNEPMDCGGPHHLACRTTVSVARFQAGKVWPSAPVPLDASGRAASSDSTAQAGAPSSPASSDRSWALSAVESAQDVDSPGGPKPAAVDGDGMAARTPRTGRVRDPALTPIVTDLPQRRTLRRPRHAVAVQKGS